MADARTRNDGEIARQLQEAENSSMNPISGTFVAANDAAQANVPMATAHPLPPMPARQPRGGRVLAFHALPVPLLAAETLAAGYPAGPPGAPPGGMWVEATHFGPASAACCCLWSILFWPLALCIPFFPIDKKILYRAPDASFWHPSGHFAGFVY